MRSGPEAVGGTAIAAAAEPAARARAATPAAALPATTEPATTRTLIWRLQSGGWTPVEAGNLAAIALGLKPSRMGWTGSEIDHLRFLRSLVSAGRIEH